MMTYMKNWNMWLKSRKIHALYSTVIVLFIAYFRQHRQIIRKPTANPEPFQISKNK
jgi:hypothetical protein